MTKPMITLATGEAVPNDDPAWRDECFKRWERVVAMRGLSIHARRAALAEVEAKEGALSRQRLEDEFKADWQSRKGAAK